MMDKDKKKRLKQAGWETVSVKDLLSLSDDEESYVELKLQLSRALKQRRQELHWSQQALAVRIKSSQSRIAKMESADPTVSIDLLVRGLIATGVRRTRLASTLGAPETNELNDTVS